MTKDELDAHIARVEAQKDKLRHHPKWHPSLSYDEAVYRVAKPTLIRFLSDVAFLPDISESGNFYFEFEKFCLEQIRQIVDTALCILLSKPFSPMRQRPGRRAKVVTRDHDLLVPRAKSLIYALEGRLSGPDFSKRYSSVLFETEDLMNTTDWKRLARGFCSAYAK